MITCCGAAPGWTGPTALASVLAPALGRDPDQLAGQLPVGPPAHCAEVLSRYAAAGAREVLLWPIRDPIGQLEECAEQVMPVVPGQRACPPP